MDTTTVNFAINKLTDGWKAVAPTVADVGEKYVRYVVTIQVIQFAISAAFLLAAIGFTMWSARFIRARWAKASETHDQPPYILLGVLAGCFLISAFIAACVNGFDAGLAVTNPEMFTVHEAIRAASGRP